MFASSCLHLWIPGRYPPRINNHSVQLLSLSRVTILTHSVPLHMPSSPRHVFPLRLLPNLTYLCSASCRHRFSPYKPFFSTLRFSTPAFGIRITTRLTFPSLALYWRRYALWRTLALVHLYLQQSVARRVVYRVLACQWFRSRMKPMLVLHLSLQLNELNGGGKQALETP